VPERCRVCIVRFMRARGTRPAVAGVLALTLGTGCSEAGSGGATGNVPRLRTGTTAAAIGSPSGEILATPSAAASTSGAIPALTPTPGGSATASSPVSIGVPPPTAVVPGTPAPGDYSDAAVLAAAKAYLAGFAASLRTGDAGPFLSVTQVSCGCRSVFLPVFAKRRKDGIVTTFMPRPEAVRVVTRSSYSATVTMKSVADPYEVHYSDGRMAIGRAGTKQLTVDLKVLDRRWLAVATR